MSFVAVQALKFKNKGILSILPLINAAGSVSVTANTVPLGELLNAKFHTDLAVVFTLGLGPGSIISR